MLDFLDISVKQNKNGMAEISPNFLVESSTDLMIRGGDFYAIWDEEHKLWSTNQFVAIKLIDKELDKYKKEHAKDFEDIYVKVLHLKDSNTGMIDRWRRYVHGQMPDHFISLDENVIFANTETCKEDYSSRKLPYALEEGDISAYDELMSVLYLPDERKKIEWAIGSIISGDSKNNQKFCVLYGPPKSGKSTVLNIIEFLFTGYWKSFNAKELGSATSQFALESLAQNPLVAIQHDGDLSRIEDNTRLNSLVSHEYMPVNTKNKSIYTARFNCFLFMGTNKPVKITDSKSGILRRLIDVTPTGERVSGERYDILMSKIKFELGAIAYHCLDVYNKNKRIYNNYVPTAMLGASNDFYNFVQFYYDDFKEKNSTTLTYAWDKYNSYCNYAKVQYPYPQRLFKEELKNYFRDYKDRYTDSDGSRIRSYYSGFIFDKFEISRDEKSDKAPSIDFKVQTSLFDSLYFDAPAQLANVEGTPSIKWNDVKTTLKDIDTHLVHYVRLPENHIVIDFDLKDESGNKNYILNLEAASKWPETYAELSKSGQGIHLHYIYTGDVSELSSVYAKDIEVKIFTGKSSLRRMLTKCNNSPIAKLTPGALLPKRTKKKMVDWEALKNEKDIRKRIFDKLQKKNNPPYTKPCIDYIYNMLESSYEKGLSYDVTDLRSDILAFASASRNNAKYCVRLVSKMKLQSKDMVATKDADGEIVIFDVEVKPNLCLIVWKLLGKDKSCVRIFNPKPDNIEKLLKYKLIGYNNLRYDNHILYGILLGYNNKQTFDQSVAIIEGRKDGLFAQSRDFSFTDVFDYCSKKQSLKKWEIELGIPHKEFDEPWDQPISKDRWDDLAKYCENDVKATEAVHIARQADFIAREILADLAEGKVNDTTNQLTQKIIFGSNKNPQDQFVYTDLSKFFPGYKFEGGKSTYKGIEVGEGGLVIAAPGMYRNVWTFDVASMHPNSIIQLNLFGDIYTARFKELLDVRIAIKHKDFEKAKTMLGGALAKYLDDPSKAKALSDALKIAINSVYGLTAAKFPNAFRDPRNIDNIVAKRGALFMVDLKEAVEKMGGEVVHIKTDSIKVVNPSEELKQFIFDFGKKYGYTFEVEHIFERFCLVNGSTYVGKLASNDPEDPGKWTATAEQFQQPYIFKKLFSHEPIEFEDMRETKSVTKGDLYLDFGEVRRYVGRIGQFTPIKEGKGGGRLLRVSGDKDYAVGGTKGFYWLESDDVKAANKFDDIDESYYIAKLDDAIASIKEYGDFESFVD